MAESTLAERGHGLTVSGNELGYEIILGLSAQSSSGSGEFNRGRGSSGFTSRKGFAGSLYISQHPKFQAIQVDARASGR